MKNILIFLFLFSVIHLFGATSHEVVVTNNIFTPRDLTISMGDTVKWVNQQGTHNVNGSTETYPDNPESFRSGNAVGAPWEFSFVFTVAGSYNYQCDPHVSLDMKGTIMVNAVQAEPAKIIITEFMYNNPGAGTDTLEFIELYNNGTETVNMAGYFLDEAVEFTFPDVNMLAGDFLVVAVDSVAFERNFGVATFQWDGALNNSGEAILLKDPSGMTIDSVRYSDDPPWDDTADGDGPSLELCDFGADNSLGSNWAPSSTGTGKFFDNIEYLATPGVANNCILASYPAYTVGEVTGVDANGVADSISITCTLQGIVYGVNLNSDGLQFTLIDGNNDGIGVFSNSQNFGYSVAEGDEVQIKGIITQFRGMTQIEPDSLFLLSSGNTLVAPTEVTVLGEATESQLIQIKNVSLVNPTQWKSGDSDFDIDLTDGTNSFSMRIDENVDIFLQEDPPSGSFTVTGLGRQFDTSEPLDDGYQIMPRYLSDIDPFIPDAVDIPLYDIGVVSTNDVNGEPDSIDIACRLKGIVHSINFRPGGLDVHIIDDKGDGIVVFNVDEDFGYSAILGDEVLVEGSIGFFNGLTEIVADTILVLSSGNALMDPLVVTELDESTEAQLIKIENVTLVDPNQWGMGTNSGFNVDITDGTNTYDLRIDADTDLFNTSAPATAFNVTGVGTQFDNSAPYDTGYQILPRFMADIEPSTSIWDARIAEKLEVFPNPVQDRIILRSDLNLKLVYLTNMFGQQLRSWSNLSTGSNQLEVHDLPSGLYVLSFRIGERFWSTKVIKK